MPTARSLIGCLLALNAWAQGTSPQFNETVVFNAGESGYHTFRIPAVARSSSGTLLAFCEGRKNSASDSGDIDLVLRRSTNNGCDWSAIIVVQDEGGTLPITIGNPVPVIDRTTGVIHLLFCRNNERVFHTASTNEGVTWSPRIEITTPAKLPDWGWYATGPGHGIQLIRGTQKGRLVVPCDHSTISGVRGAHVIYSDDHGMNWQLGALAASAGGVNPNETLAEELVGLASDGGTRLYFNTRDQSGTAPGTRGEAWSIDGGTSFTAGFTNRTSFVCPVAQGSVVRWRAEDQGDGQNRLLFSCPNHSSSRVRMSVWSSTNEALTWSTPKLLYADPSAYSDMAALPNGSMALLYEKGISSPYETITLAVFNEAWLDAPTLPEENPQAGFWTFEEFQPGQKVSTNQGGIHDRHPLEGGNHLTAQGDFPCVPGSERYGPGTALTFDVSGGLQISDVRTLNHFDFGPTQSFTLEAVFRLPLGSAQTGALIAKDYAPVQPSWWLRVENGKLRFLVSDDAAESSVTASQLVNDGLWHHVGAVRNADGPTKRLELYLDGQWVTNHTDSTTGSLANSQPLNVGRFGASATRNFSGDIDLVRITPHALTSSEFVQRYTQLDADGDLIPDSFEWETVRSLKRLGPGDADHDGTPDVVEFALGTDPTLRGSGPQSVLGADFGAVRVYSTQRVLPGWLRLELQTSLDLEHWRQANPLTELSPADGAVWHRIDTLFFPSGSPGAQFLRLRLLDH